MRIASGALLATNAAIADATGAPGRPPCRAPTSKSVVAPNSPAWAANDAPSPHVTAETVVASERACVRSSSEVVVNEPFDGSTTTQMFDSAMAISLQNLDRFEEGHDALG